MDCVNISASVKPTNYDNQKIAETVNSGTDRETEDWTIHGKFGMRMALHWPTIHTLYNMSDEHFLALHAD